MTGSSPPPRHHGPRRLQWGLSKPGYGSPTPDRSSSREESVQPSNGLAATGTHSPTTSDVPNVEDVRRQILREVLEAIAAQSTHELDKGIGYRLDVQAVAACAEELSNKAREDALCNVEERIAKKVKVARDRATKEADERGARSLASQKQKFEEEIKRLKLEKEKQNKKCTEIEKEKRQAFCDAAQHSRNLKSLAQDLEKSRQEEDSAKKALEKQNRLARRAEGRMNQSEQNCQAELRAANETIVGLEVRINEMERHFKEAREYREKVCSLAPRNCGRIVQSKDTTKQTASPWYRFQEFERDLAASLVEANIQRESDVAEAVEQERKRSFNTTETVRRQRSQLMDLMKTLKEDATELWQLQTPIPEGELHLEGSKLLIEEARDLSSQVESIINNSNEYKTRLRWIEEKVAGFGKQSIEDLFSELENTRVQVAKLDSEKSTLDGQLETEKKRCGEISVDAEKLIAQNETLSKRVKDLESSTSIEGGGFANLADQNASTLELLEAKQEETLQSRRRTMELEECLEAAENEVSVLKESIADKRKEIDGLETSFQEAANALKLKEDSIPGTIAHHVQSCEVSFSKAVQTLCDRYFPNKIPANDDLAKAAETFKWRDETDAPLVTHKRAPLKTGRRTTGSQKQLARVKKASCTDNSCPNTRSHKELMDAVDDFNTRRREGCSRPQKSTSERNKSSAEFEELLKLEFWILRTLVDTSLLKREHDEVARELKNAVSKVSPYHLNTFNSGATKSTECCHGQQVSAAQEETVQQEGERGLAFRLVRALTSEKRDLSKRLKRTEQHLKSLSTSRHSTVQHGNQSRTGGAIDSPPEMVAQDCILQDMREVVAVMEVLHGQSPSTTDMPK
ncbi:hypothetical protein BSKO_04574 [Bryopsis sp. KO-2023]|nr:hypothetical protein BSKO_04574 [Bryopsis sp. KO-2023]